MSDRHSVTQSTIVVADVQADAHLGLGISVIPSAGGGFVVQSVMENGPADRDGRIRAGDHLLSVDGHSLGGATHAEANRLLSQSRDTVRIVASRTPGKSDPLPDTASDCSEDCVSESWTGSVRELSGGEVFVHSGADGPVENGDLRPEVQYPATCELADSGFQPTESSNSCSKEIGM